MLQKILVAIDRSDLSHQAFEQAIELAKLANAQLKLIHVLAPHEESYPNPVFPMDSNYPLLQTEMLQTQMQAWALLEQQGLALLQSQADRAKAAGVAIEFSQSFGNPGRVICELARSWGADLIVLGRRGHSGLKAMLLGSVSNYVIHHAPCSVWVVQDREAPAELADQT